MAVFENSPVEWDCGDSTACPATSLALGSILNPMMEVIGAL